MQGSLILDLVVYTVLRGKLVLVSGMHCEPMMTDVDSEGSISTSASSSPGAARTPPDEPQDAEASSEVLKGDDDNLSVASGDKPCCAPDDVDGESSTSSTQRETERQGQGKPEGQLVRTFYTDVTEEINLHFSKTVAAMAAKHFQQQQQQHGRGSSKFYPASLALESYSLNAFLHSILRWKATAILQRIWLLPSTALHCEYM